MDVHFLLQWLINFLAKGSRGPFFVSAYRSVCITAMISDLHFSQYCRDEDYLVLGKVLVQSVTEIYGGSLMSGSYTTPVNRLLLYFYSSPTFLIE